MDKLRAIEVFVRVVETGSFTRAAERLKAPKASVSTLVQDLEAQLGVRLLQRTTRRVVVTADGAAYYERCLRILEDLRDADESLSSRHASPGGRLRVDVATSMASHLLVPALPDFVRRYPEIRLELGCSDRPVNLVAEGVDCAVRAGSTLDPSLIARRVATLRFVNCAAPSYLNAAGRPTHPQELQAHRCLNYLLQSTGRIANWDFVHGDQRLEIGFDSPITVNDSNVYTDACLAGLGIGQLPSFVFALYRSSGLLEAVLPDWVPEPLPVHVVYPSNRHLSTKVRVFAEWVAERLSALEDLRL